MSSETSVFEGALDRFSQFFISPLFNESCTDRELKAVDSGNVLFIVKTFFIASYILFSWFFKNIKEICKTTNGGFNNLNKIYLIQTMHTTSSEQEIYTR